jgi:uncharacterized protein YndB with AHSA1/START domain
MEASKKESIVTRIHEIYIKASPLQIWEAITTPGWTERYGYGAAVELDLQAGGDFRYKANAQMKSFGLPDTIIDGKVLEVDPPRKLVHTYRWLFSDANRAEGFTRVTWEIEQTEAGFCRLSVTHELQGAPMMAAATISKFDTRGGGGWNWILSDLKSLLETGKRMSG